MGAGCGLTVIGEAIDYGALQNAVGLIFTGLCLAESHEVFPVSTTEGGAWAPDFVA